MEEGLLGVIWFIGFLIIFGSGFLLGKYDSSLKSRKVTK